MENFASYKVTTASTTLPVSLAELKLAMGMTQSNKDNDLTMCLEAAVDYVEREAWTSFTTKTITQTHDDGFPTTIYLSQPPAQSVTSITYIDTDGETQTLASDQYVVDVNSAPARVYEAYNVTWPTTLKIKNAVTVKFLAGYGDAATDVPKIAKRIIIAIASDIFEHLESQSEIKLTENMTSKYSLDSISFRRPY
jgi:uncharacterized phiE125 gp8 family phage protein